MWIQILAYIIIPVYTILFTRGYNWFTTNFSVIGNILDKKLAFFIWGFMVGGYFYMIFRQLKLFVRMRTVCRGLMIAALILLFCGITTPYLPEALPFKSSLHIVFAFLAGVFLLLFLLTVIWQQYQLCPETYRIFLAALGGIVIISVILLFLVGIVSSALEIFLTISTVILSELLLRKISGQINTP